MGEPRARIRHTGEAEGEGQRCTQRSKKKGKPDYKPEHIYFKQKHRQTKRARLGSGPWEPPSFADSPGTKKKKIGKLCFGDSSILPLRLFLLTTHLSLKVLETSAIIILFLSLSLSLSLSLPSFAKAC